MQQINLQPPTTDPWRLTLMTTLSTIYDLQKLRIQIGNRLCANFYDKLGIKPSESAQDADDEVKKMIKRIKADYDKMTEGVVSLTKENGHLNLPRAGTFKPGELISTMGEFALFQQYLSLEQQESDHTEKILPQQLQGIPVYDHYLAHVRGVGPLMAGVLLRYLDINKAKYPSSFIKRAGLDVVLVPGQHPGEIVAQGRKAYKTHLVPRTYTKRDGETIETVGLSYEPFLKTKLIGVLGVSFLRSKSPYAQVYANYKHRIENMEQHKNKTPKHRHNMAVRYMIKQFLVDFHQSWLEVLGKDPKQTYAEAILGRLPHTEGIQRINQSLGFDMARTRVTYPVFDK